MNDTTALDAERLFPAGIVAAMAAVAVLGFHGIFSDWSFLPAAIIGAVGAMAVSVTARWARLGASEALSLSLVAFVLVGTIAASGVPTPSAFGVFFDGLVNGWAEVLSSSPPADLTAEFRVLPFTVAWFGSALGGEVLRSSRTPGLAAVGPVAALGLSLLITLENRRVALTQGALLLAGALLLGFFQQRKRSEHAELFEDVTLNPVKRRTGFIPALAAVALIGVTAPMLGPRLPLAESNDRFDLREFQTPPFDPLEVPSPLVQVKASLVEPEDLDEPMLSVTFAGSIAEDDRARYSRITLAVLDDYNEEFFTVADERGDAPGEFSPIDSRFPAPTDSPIELWDERVEATITVGDIESVGGSEFDPPWLPVIGWPTVIESGDDLDVRFNAVTGTAALVEPDGPRNGLTYTVQGVLPPSADDPAIRDDVVSLLDEEFDLALGPLIQFARSVFTGEPSGLGRVEALRSRLQTGGYEVQGEDARSRPGHTIGRLAEFVREPEALAGFEEQYAATAALLGRSQGIETRVVVGYLVQPDQFDDRWDDNTLTVLAADMSAWIEVRFDGHGWVPFDVTPDRTNEPNPASAGNTRRPVAIPNPPPDPPPPILPPRLDREEEALEEDQEEEEDAADDEAAGSFPVRTVALAAAVSSPFVLVGAAATSVVLLKRRRTRRRRNAGTPARRVAGAWHEVVDRWRESGPPMHAATTPREFALGVRASDAGSVVDGTVLVALADDVNAAAYHPTPSSDAEAIQAWERSDQLVAEIAAGQSMRRRIRSRLDPRPLFKNDPLLTDGMTDE